MEEEIILVPPGYYTVEIINDKKVRITEGPFKGREIFCRLPNLVVKITHEKLGKDDEDYMKVTVNG